MRLALAALVVATVACGSATPAPAVGTPLNATQLKFAVMDSVGKPVYCDPDFYPIARQGGEEANAVSTYPQIKADAETYAAIVAHEHLPSGDLTDAQKLVVSGARTFCARRCSIAMRGRSMSMCARWRRNSIGRISSTRPNGW